MIAIPGPGIPGSASTMPTIKRAKSARIFTTRTGLNRDFGNGGPKASGDPRSGPVPGRLHAGFIQPCSVALRSPRSPLRSALAFPAQGQRAPLHPRPQLFELCFAPGSLSGRHCLRSRCEGVRKWLPKDEYSRRSEWRGSVGQKRHCTAAEKFGASVQGARIYPVVPPSAVLECSTSGIWNRGPASWK
jgi:hypothetical protein